jgi:TusA-related sulfurtransferase
MKEKLPKVDLKINLKGDICPYTFVKSKLALETLESGQVLQVLVDHLPATENVPRSMANEGHKVLGVQQVNDTDWIITIQKK